VRYLRPLFFNLTPRFRATLDPKIPGLNLTPRFRAKLDPKLPGQNFPFEPPARFSSGSCFLKNNKYIYIYILTCILIFYSATVALRVMYRVAHPRPHTASYPTPPRQAHAVGPKHTFFRMAANGRGGASSHHPLRLHSVLLLIIKFVFQ
jgi:hypothetical protein